MILQYADSPRIKQLLSNMEQYLDVSKPLDDFYNIVWNVDTAQGFGLDIWGRIVGVQRYLSVIEGNHFGFETASTPQDFRPFNDSVFYAGPTSSSTYRLADDAFRVLILAKALTNIVATTSPAINQVLQNLFPGRGRCYVNDLGSMQMRYTFEFALQPWEWSVLTSSGALPRPAGVNATIAVIPLPNTFGFAEAGTTSAAPFGQGTYFSTGAIQNAA